MEKLIIPLILILARPDKLKGAVAELESHPIGLIVIALGLILIVVQLIQPVRAVFDFCYVYFFRPSRNLQRFGSWAVVTGATDGIGKAYCEALARKGTCSDFWAAPDSCSFRDWKNRKLVFVLGCDTVLYLQASIWCWCPARSPS